MSAASVSLSCNGNTRKLILTSMHEKMHFSCFVLFCFVFLLFLFVLFFSCFVSALLFSRLLYKSIWSKVTKLFRTPIHDYGYVMTRSFEFPVISNFCFEKAVSRYLNGTSVGLKLL